MTEETKPTRNIRSLGGKRQQLTDTELVRVSCIIPEKCAVWLNTYAAKNNVSLSFAMADVIKSCMAEGDGEPEAAG